jgi:N-acetyl-alpha-D-muramate 1-phosphate uridylyltransferase
MKAMLLAAGRGKRMGSLTEQVPKPLLPLGESTLIDYQLSRVHQAGITECLINVRYHADKIQSHCGDGSRFGLKITYSVEQQDLETAGGIIKALPFFTNEPFVLMSSDVLCEYPLQNLALADGAQAHCVLVDNPSHHPQGDFGLAHSFLTLHGNKLTYANQGIYHPQLFSGFTPGFRKLRDVLVEGIRRRVITGEHYQGRWQNIDTPERLALANTGVKK